jgi:hypothetical protein
MGPSVNHYMKRYTRLQSQHHPFGILRNLKHLSSTSCHS